MKEPSKLILSTGILVWCALFSPPCLSAPFTNGSFELLGGLNDNSTIEITSPGFLPGWTVGGIGVTGYIRGIVAGGFDISPFEGSYKLSFNGGNTLAGTWISQTFDTVVGESYELSFYVGRIGGAGDIGLRVSVTNQSGDTLVVQDACPPSTKGWGPLQRLFFTATSLNTTVTFLQSQQPRLGTGLLHHFQFGEQRHPNRGQQSTNCKLCDRQQWRCQRRWNLCQHH